MDLSEVKRALSRKVYIDLDDGEHEYIFNGCTIRLGAKGEYLYSAELQDVKQPKSVLIVDLEKVRATRRTR